jgi:hypothetical protein
MTDLHYPLRLVNLQIGVPLPSGKGPASKAADARAEAHALFAPLALQGWLRHSREARGRARMGKDGGSARVGKDGGRSEVLP